MGRLFIALITLLSAVSSIQDAISVVEVELRVRPGDNVVLHCDVKHHDKTHWHRNSSIENRGLYSVSNQDIMDNPGPRFYFLWRSQQFWDLLIENVSESDLGLYYCGSWKKKLLTWEGVNDKVETFIYGNGNVITRLSFDCGLCWMLLFSLCPVSALLSSLLSSTCVYSFCRTAAPTETQVPLNRTTTRGSESREKEAGDLFYASLDIRQGPKKKTVQNSDFSTYSAIDTSRV